MSKYVKTTAVVCILTLLISSLFSCNDTVQENTGIDWSNYKVVVPARGAGVDEAVSAPGSYSKKSVISSLLEKTESLSGKKAEMVSDSTTPTEYEIMIGDCDRPEYKAVAADLKYNDYRIVREDNKFIIAACNVNKRTAAVKKFIELMPSIKADDKDGTLAEVIGNYTAKALVLNNTDIREYTIVYSSEMTYSPAFKETVGYYESNYKELIFSPADEMGAVNHFDYYLVKYCGYRLKIIGKTEYLRNPEKYPHIIAFGDCGILPNESGELLESEYAVLSDGNNIAVYGGRLTHEGSSKLGNLLATEFFGKSPVTNGIMSVNFGEGRIDGHY